MACYIKILQSVLLVLFFYSSARANLSISEESSNQANIPLVINELMASNSNTQADPQGQYDDWIEIYNYGPDAVNMGGMYITDNLNAPTRWRIPTGTTISSGGYLLIWADGDTSDTGLHADFKLDADGEQIGLFDTDGSTLIDSVTFGGQSPDVSYGRDPNYNDSWHFLSVPTPGEENSGGYLGEVEAPKLSYNRGFYDEPFSLTIATETEDADIYYSLDASEPYIPGPRDSIFGILYTGPITIDKTTCLRTQAVKAGWKDSMIETRTYIFPDDVILQPENPEGFPTYWGSRTADYEMDSRVVDDPAYSDEIKDDLKSTPSICIVIPNRDFFGSEGIYANPTQTGDQWERAASVEWIDPDTGGNFGVNAGLRIHGGPYSRSGNIKNALRVTFRSEYGLSKLEYPLFPDTEVTSFNTLALRSIWNYSWSGHSGMYGSENADYLRDAFARDTIRDLGRLTPHGRAVQVYINGLYWGLYIMTERPDEHFSADHLGGDKDNYDMLEAPSGYGSSTTMEIISGGLEARQAWDTLFELAGENLAFSESYKAIQEYIDIPAMIDYMLMIYYVGSRDAPVYLGDSYTPRNFYVVRKHEPAEPFIIVPWDTEWSLEQTSVNRVNVVGIVNPHYLVDKLLANSDFKMLLADHIYRHFYNNGALTSEKTTQRYMKLAAEIYGAIVGESARWGDEPRSWQPYTRDVEWMGEVDRLLNEYFSIRTEIVIDQLRQAGFYPFVSPPEFSISNINQNQGYILPGTIFSISSEQGTIYYTLDGTDPRIPGTSQQLGDVVTLVSEDASKRVFVPTGSVRDTWKGGGSFSDITWTIGTGGVGYEAGSGYQNYFDIDLYNQMYGSHTSCYIRIPFYVAQDTTQYGAMTLRMRYDDGFIAYINGTEVARRNFDGTPSWNSSADTTCDDSAAISFEDIDISSYMNSLVSGDNILAIHGLNVSTTSSDFLISAELMTYEIIEDDSPSDDEIPSSVIEYTGPITLTESTHIKARVQSGGTWSALNETAYSVGPVAENLRITEIMYHPKNDSDEEFIELTNTGDQTINLNLVKFTNGIDFTFPSLELAPGEYIVVVQDIADFQNHYGTDVTIAGQYSGRLSNAGEKIELEDAAGRTILEFSYKDGWRSITDGDGFSLTIINPANPDPNSWDDKDSWRASAYTGGSPGWDDDGIIPDPGSVVINELLAHSHAGEPDWIELYNTTDTSIDIGGWFLSDSNSNLSKYEISEGIVIAPYGYIVFYEDSDFDNSSDPGSHTGFALSDDGEKVYLSSGHDGLVTGYREVEDFGASQTGVSFGRYFKSSTGNYNFVALSEATAGSANSYPKVGPVVISEIMYNPDWPVGGSYTNDQYEYIELCNISSSSVTLYDQSTDLPWKFTDGIEYVFSTDEPVTIPAGGRILIVRHPDAFSLHYPDVSSGVVFGPYDGGLANSSETIELSMPGELDGSANGTYIRVDRVVYSDGSHHEDCPGGIDLWPVEADGEGYSLTRRELSDYGNDPDNWLAASPTPGQ